MLVKLSLSIRLVKLAKLVKLVKVVSLTLVKLAKVVSIVQWFFSTKLFTLLLMLNIVV